MSSETRQAEASETAQFRYSRRENEIYMFLVDDPETGWAVPVGFFQTEDAESDLEGCIGFLKGFRHIKNLPGDSAFPCELYDSAGNLVRKGAVLDRRGQGRINDYVWEEKTA